MRKLAAIGSVAALTTAGLLMGVTQANADAHGTCRSGQACLYENFDFNNGNTDHWRDFSGNNGNFNNVVWKDSNGSDSSDHMDNETSSIRNRRGCRVRLWQDVGAGGAYTDFNNNVDDGYLSNNSIGDNRASAISIYC